MIEVSEPSSRARARAVVAVPATSPIPVPQDSWSLGRPAVMVAVALAELDQIRHRFGTAGEAQARRAVAVRWLAALPGAQLFAADAQGALLFTVPRSLPGRMRQRLERASTVVAGKPVTVAGEQVQLTPLVGYVPLRGPDPSHAARRAQTAAAAAAHHLDLVPVPWNAALERSGPRHRRESPPIRVLAWVRSWRTTAQVLVTFGIGVGVPFLGYLAADRAGIGRQVTSVVYALVVAALLATAVSLYWEGLRALEPTKLPQQPPGPLPPATAIIAAYLPNESATILDTVEAFLGLDYPSLQVVLAYNTPHPMPVEAVLAQLAERDPRLVLLNVAASTSKAQNVNAALAVVSGVVVGIFDADHHPAPGAFQRAWRWLDAGYGVVQGHCVIRNGDASWLSRMVAVEFEHIYAVAHPGRAALHGFGIFGGSNGYWNAALLRSVRMRASMLTEDIDSSMRVILQGHHIASDPGLLSRELAPTRLRTLATQRLRWAQGWTQVSRKYLPALLRSRHTSLRMKAGAAFLLGWREIYPWLSLQIFPLLVHAAFVPGAGMRWGVSLFVVTTLLTTPEIRGHPRWFVGYLLLSALFYSEFTNTVARVAQLKELMRERTWRVTARAEAPQRPGRNYALETAA
ncbi:MAG: glycosyltransferase family 2 protein [Pseudonocardiaceae bacterium]